MISLLSQEDPGKLNFWLEDLYTPGFDSLLKKKEAELKRSKICRILTSVILSLCAIVIVIAVPIVATQKKDWFRKLKQEDWILIHPMAQRISKACVSCKHKRLLFILIPLDLFEDSLLCYLNIVGAYPSCVCSRLNWKKETQMYSSCDAIRNNSATKWPETMCKTDINVHICISYW